MTRPSLFFLHALGSSAQEWAEITGILKTNFDCIALDLLGFGDAAARSDTSVESMLDWLEGEIRSRAPTAWMPVGHSMGGKLATLIAARAERGEPGLAGLAGVVLLAASPPSPEPMDDERRAEMIGWAANGRIARADAETFVSNNVACPLPPLALDRAVRDVQRADPGAWRAWLERGSREDWSAGIDLIDAPALLMAGAEDGDLDADAQQRLNLPHFTRGRIVTIEGAAHLLPYEQPEAVARHIERHWQTCLPHILPSATTTLLGSDRVSRRTRKTLLSRRLPVGDGEPTCLGRSALATLAAMIAQILPGACDPNVLARRIDRNLASGQGDGWRFADLPPDAQAWSAGLRALDGFSSLDRAVQGERLDELASGKFPDTALSGAQLRLWFEDVRSEVVRTWLSLPAAMARIGYDGFATGGDGERLQGFGEVGTDHVEQWQPAGDRQ